MPFLNLLQSIKGQCRHCGQQAGVFQRNHEECRESHQAGWQEIVSLVTQAATDHSFNEAALRQSLSDVAQHYHATEEDVERVLEEGGSWG